MEIEVTETEKRDAKAIKIHMKVCDTFACRLVDAAGRTIAEQTDDYVPSFMPGNHYGDYVILDIDIETGQITNWKKPESSELADWVDEHK